MSDNESKSEEKIQKHIGWKWWTAIGALATLAIAIFTVLNYFTPFKTSILSKEKPVIAAKARYRYIDLPMSYENALDSINSPRKISADKEIEAFIQKLPEKSRKDAIEAISHYISFHMPYYLGGRSQDRGRGFLYGWWDIDIENISDVTVYDVVLEIPGFIVVTEVFRKSSGTIEIKENKDYLKIGDLRPRENVSISAWTTDRFPNITSEKFKLTHKDGVGKVHIK